MIGSSFVQRVPSSRNRFLNIVCSSWVLGLILAASRILEIRLEYLDPRDESNGDEEVESSLELLLFLGSVFLFDGMRLLLRIRLWRFFVDFGCCSQFEEDVLGPGPSASELNNRKMKLSIDSESGLGYIFSYMFL